MALVNCPKCGESISDKAQKCVHCGYVLSKICSECGAELEDNVTVCRKCGCPVEGEENIFENNVPQQVEVTSVKIPKTSKKTMKIAIITLIVIGFAILSIQQIQKQNASKNYSENLELVTTKMIAGAATAEACGNLIKQVWYNSIYKKTSTDTNTYTRPNGYFVGFNNALQNLFADSSFSSSISSIKSNQSTVESLMKELKNPPKEYKDAYNSLISLYDAYLELTNLVIDPSGSLQTFSSNFNDADSKTCNSYSSIKVYLD